MNAGLPRFAGAVLGILLFSGTALAQTLQMNASWWQQTHDAERTGFVLGFYDCPEAPEKIRGATSGDYIEFVDRQVQHETRSNALIPDLLRAAHRGIRARPALKGGEVFQEEHGWLDGEWWGDATHGNSTEKIGYVEGYLACEARPVDMNHVRQCVDLLNTHFATAGSEHDKIAKVLQIQLDREMSKS